MSKKSTTSQNDGDEQHIKVCRTYVHPEYKGTMNDIALLKLCHPVETADNVGFIDLPSAEGTNAAIGWMSFPQIGKPVYLSG